MKLMFPRNSFVGTLLSILVLSLILTVGVSAQSKKTSAKKAADKKSQSSKKDAKKESAKSKSKSKASDKTTASAKDKKSKSKKDSAEAKRIAAEKRRVEAERRQAALEEKRRREQAAREARARKIAFERGLHTETIANISNDNTDGEDLRVRQAAVNALGSHAGSVVVMEAQTGKVLTIVNQEWAVRSSIRPCSTIKLVTAAAGLDEGVISKEDGSINHRPSRRDLDDAIAFSDNGYFQRVGANIGNQKLVQYGQKLGLGAPTGINLEGETAGRLPYNNSNPRIYSHGDDTEVSTLQLAVMVSAITNGGDRVIPRIPRNSEDKVKFQPFYRAKVDIPQQNVRRMIPGMMGAAEYGTARRNMDQSLGVAGKTGSCIDKGSWVGLFTSVAPIEQPKYAVAVITRGQSERGRYAAAVAAQIYEALSDSIVRTDRNLAMTEFHIMPKNNASMAARNPDGDEDSADEAFDSEGREVITVPSAGKPLEKQPYKKLITRTGDSRPVFPPVVITYDRTGKGKKETIKP